MSVSIRLAKYGKRNAPSYRVVVAQTKTKRSGKFIDILGHYNPMDKNSAFEIDKKRYEEWKDKGAIISNAVESLIAGDYKFEKYDPKGKKQKEAAQAAEKAQKAAEIEPKTEETPASEEPSEEEQSE